LYLSSYIIGVLKLRRMKWVEYETHMGEMRNAYKMLARQPDGKRPLWRLTCKWVNIRIDLKEIMYDMNWIHPT
jgi:hypothetical protein